MSVDVHTLWAELEERGALPSGKTRCRTPATAREEKREEINDWSG